MGFLTGEGSLGGYRIFLVFLAPYAQMLYSAAPCARASIECGPLGVCPILSSDLAWLRPLTAAPWHHTSDVHSLPGAPQQA